MPEWNYIEAKTKQIHQANKKAEVAKINNKLSTIWGQKHYRDQEQYLKLIK